MQTQTPQSTPDLRSRRTRRKHQREEKKAYEGKLEYWLKRKSWKWVFVVLVLYLVAGCGIGFIDAWEILVGRESAKAAGWPAVTWPLSIVGWVLVPAFIGGVAGYVVTSQIESRRGRPISMVTSRLAKEAKDRNKPPSQGVQ